MTAAVLDDVRSEMLAEAEAVASVARDLGPELLDIAEAILACPGRILVIGSGTSKSVATRLAHLMCCVGKPAHFLHPADALHGGAGAVSSGDMLLVVSKGGTSAEVNGLVRIARRRGASVVALTRARNSELVGLADRCLWVDSPDSIDPFGMIATGSSLAAAAAGDALCLAVLKLGKYTVEDFAMTHPSGAVGERIRAGAPEDRAR